MLRLDRRSRDWATMAAEQCRSAVSIQSLLPTYYRPLSLALYQVLENSGASEEVRNLWKETCTTVEIIGTIGKQPEQSVYSFGSSGEGTTTVDMNPDLDMVFVNNRFPVETDCSDIPGEKCLLMVQDNDTRAGYAKLQLVYNRVPLYNNDYGISNALHFNLASDMISCADKNNRLVISFSPEHGLERHGPAQYIASFTNGSLSADLVPAFNLSKLPVCVEEWTSRTRNHNWPSADVLDQCKRLGCLFVPVGHPHSDEQHLEWRLSLSHQERLLVSQFNSVQHKCYILLKLWKKEILPSCIEQESLSSYHCKTCMFYMIENTSSDFWRPDNLLGCFVACKRLFLLWTTNGICPNYFIPAENMFDRRIHGEIQRKLQQALELNLTADCKYLMQIRTSHIGDRLVSYVTMSLSNGHFFLEGFISNYIETNLRFLPITKSHNRIMHRCMQRRFSIRSQRCLKNIYNFTQHLKHTNTITEHTVEETKRAIFYFVPYLELHLMTGIIALAEQQGRTREEIGRYLFSDSWHQLSFNSDISVKLKQASLMYMFEYYHASLDILSPIVLRGVCSMCNCYKISFLEPMSAATEEIISAIAVRPNVTMEHMANRVLVGCIVFLPTEGNVTPDAIRYEMLRFADDTPGYTGGLAVNFLRECAVVDGLFLYYFLLYLNHSKLNMGSHVRADISNMNYTISARVKCSHREACLNILGWVYKDQGCIETAMECFRRSLEMKPRGNAAVWHLRDICNLNH